MSDASHQSSSCGRRSRTARTRPGRGASSTSSGRNAVARRRFLAAEQEKPDEDVERIVARGGGKRWNGIAASHRRRRERTEPGVHPVDGVAVLAEEVAQPGRQRQQLVRVNAHPDQLACTC